MLKHDYALNWHGGKNKLVDKFLDLIPPHRVYVEVFGGGGTLLLAKQPCELEVYNDIDKGLVDFFRVLRDPDLFCKFYHHAVLTPYSRSEWYRLKDEWRKEEDLALRAWKWYIVARQSFGGRFEKSWGSVLTSESGSAERWLNQLVRLAAVADRMMHVIVECQDWREILDKYKDEGPDVLMYLDPPYVIDSTKAKKGSYDNELDTKDHQELIDTIVNYPCMIMLSGYPNPIYDKLDKNGWDRKEIKVIATSAGRTRASGLRGENTLLDGKQDRIDCLWRNPEAIRGSSQLKLGVFSDEYETSGFSRDRSEDDFTREEDREFDGKTEQGSYDLYTALEEPDDYYIE